MPIYIVEYSDAETEVFEYRLFEGPKIEDWKQFIKDLMPEAHRISLVSRGNIKTYPGWDIFDNALPRLLGDKGFIEVKVQAATISETDDEKAAEDLAIKAIEAALATEELEREGDDTKSFLPRNWKSTTFCTTCKTYKFKSGCLCDSVKPEMQYTEIEVKRNGHGDPSNANRVSGKKSSAKKG